MKKLLLIAIVALTSCVVTKKQRDRILAECPGIDSTSTTEKTVYIPHDSLIYVSSPPETLVIENPCPDSKPKIFDVKQRKNGITEEIKSDGNNIKFICKTDSLQEVIRGLNIERILSKESFEEKLRIIQQCEETWWQVLYRWGFWIMLPLILLYSGIKILKFTGWLKKIMP